MLDSDFLDSVIHSLIWPVRLPFVGVDLIFSIVLVCLCTFGCSVPFSCIIQCEFGAHWFTTVAGSHVAFCLCWCTLGKFSVISLVYSLASLLVPGEFGTFLGHLECWEVGAGFSPWVCTVSVIAMVMQCCLTVV